MADEIIEVLTELALGADAAASMVQSSKDKKREKDESTKKIDI